MPDNWGFVFAAYGLAAVVLIGYWRRLVRREKDLEAQSAPPSGRLAPGSQTSSGQTGERSHAVSISGHPRPMPDSRAPLQ
jgi:hypothetical protein